VVDLLSQHGRRAVPTIPAKSVGTADEVGGPFVAACGGFGAWALRSLCPEKLAPVLFHSWLASRPLLVAAFTYDVVFSDRNIEQNQPIFGHL
jgi:hypothetical protein